MTLKVFFELLDVALGHLEPFFLAVEVFGFHGFPLSDFVVNDLQDGAFLQFQSVFDLVSRIGKGDTLDLLLLVGRQFRAQLLKLLGDRFVALLDLLELCCSLLL